MAKLDFPSTWHRLRSRVRSLLAGAVLLAWLTAGAVDAAPPVTFSQGDRVVLLGNTFAERLQHFGDLELRLQLAFPGLGLTVRNMGWSADEVDLMPRPLAFGELEEHLADKKASVILMCFGMNESFDGKAGLSDFRNGLTALFDRLEGKNFDGRAPVRLVLISPTAHEKLPPPFPDPRERNQMLELYTTAMAEFAEQRGVPFVDLFHPSLNLMAEHPKIAFTINGIHFTDEGYRIVGGILADELGARVKDSALSDSSSTDVLRGLVVKKNEQFFLRWRPINGEYVYGRRKEPFGIVSYPPEMAELDRIIADLEKQIHAEAKRLTGGNAGEKVKGEAKQ
jgi:hypothetical protein